MKRSITPSIMTAAALLLAASLSFAADTKPGTPGETKASSAPKATQKDKKSGTAAVKLVDINSAGKAELKTLPGINDAEADKIIAGRPYGSKSHLYTRDILSGAKYDNVKALVIAKQPTTPAAKPGQK